MAERKRELSQPKEKSSLFIVDNSDAEWKVRAQPLTIASLWHGHGVLLNSVERSEAEIGVLVTQV